MSPRFITLVAACAATAALALPSLASAGGSSGPEGGVRACESQPNGQPSTRLQNPNNCNEPGAPKGCPTAGGWNWASVQSPEDAQRDKNRDGLVCKRFRQFKSQPVEVIDNYILNGSLSCEEPAFCQSQSGRRA